MAVAEQSKGVVHMRWAARILGLAFCAYMVRHIVIGVLVLGWLYILQHGWLCLWLIPIITLGIAWKWPGRQPELVAGVIFIVWSLADFIVACLGGYLNLSSFFARQMLIEGCIPVITGVLFILAYRRGLAKN
jgi:hypothetical protein